MKNKSLSKIILIGFILISIQAKADLWTIQQQWSPQVESSYQSWLHKYAKIDIFSKKFLDDKITPNPYYGITTDCADTVYGLRFLFSYEQRLPWAIRNPGSPSKLITQATKDFDRYQEGPERIKAFFKYLTNVVSTHSVANDTYPVSINDIHPGVVILTSKVNHHSWTIVDMDLKGNPRLIFNSTVGKKSGSKLQQRSSWPNPFWVFQPEEKLSNPGDSRSKKIYRPVFVPDSYAGLRYWIPVDQLLSNPKALPGYSNDQFSLDLGTWKQTIQKKYSSSKETIQEIVERLLKDACEDIKQRVTAIEESEAIKKDLPAAEQNQCLSATVFDQLSTPSRDKRLFDGIMLARAYFKYGLETDGETAFSETRLAQFKKIFTNPLASAKVESNSEVSASLYDSKSSICPIQIKNESIDLAEVKRRLVRSYISSNPNEDTIGRWGGRGSQRLSKTLTCTTYGEKFSSYDLDKAESETQDEIKAYSEQN